MTVTPVLSPTAIFHQDTAAGAPASGYKLFTYAAGTTTKQSTYTDSTGGTQNTNPVVLDTNGNANLWLDPALKYKFEFALPTDTDPPTAPIWTVDNITPQSVVSSFMAGLLTSVSSTALLEAVTYTPSGSSTPIPLQTFFGETVNLADFTGADPTGATDSSGALALAQAALRSQGGVIRVRGWYYFASAVTLNNGVVLVGSAISVGQRTNADYSTSTISSALIFAGSNPITMSTMSGVENCLIIEKNISPLGTYPLPFANATVAGNAVAAFSGNAFVPASGVTINDIRLKNVLILGFGYAFNGLSATGLNRPWFERVYMDCTNGIHVVNVFEVGRALQCECWEFTTTNQSFTTDALITRTGTAYFAGANATWFDYEDCFEFGWQIGFEVDAVQAVRHINCGVDGPATSQPGSGCIGWLYTGSINIIENICPIIAAQANTGIEVNTSAQNTVFDFKLIGGQFIGNISANGYINLVTAGSWSVSNAFFSDNDAVGHIKVATGVGPGTIDQCTFANLGATQPVFGAGAANVSYSQNKLAGTYSVTPPWSQAWSNVTGSRSAGTAYPNNTAQEITVMISVSSNESGADYQGTLVVGGVTIANDFIGGQYTGHRTIVLSFPVAVGKTYQINLGTGGAVTNWAEFR